MVIIIWQFEVRPEREEEFERVYGPSGAWARLFKEGEGYIGTQLLRTVGTPTRHVTIDRWTTKEAYENFRKTRYAEYEKLDRVCENLTVTEVEIGSFERD